MLVRDLLLIHLIYVRNKKNVFDYKLLTKMAYKFKIKFITIFNYTPIFGHGVFFSQPEHAYANLRLILNPLSVNPTKWSNALKQFVGNFPTNCLSVFDHFVRLALQGLKYVLKNRICCHGYHLITTTSEGATCINYRNSHRKQPFIGGL